jgi:hypothetical protein
MKSKNVILAFPALFLAFHASLFAQAQPSSAPPAALSATPFVHVPLAQAEEDYYKNSKSANHQPVPLAALILMGLAWGGFSLFLFAKIIRSKPRLSNSKGVSREEKD